ncbi:hypothetical protein [Streptomyces sp. NBC_00448]|uniref:hypothetical protein n=1 Tax=Streptomyces sp. NBC_00448 TaxID=2903652 RepID=UPI002E248F82
MLHLMGHGCGELAQFARRRVVSGPRFPQHAALRGLIVDGELGARAREARLIVDLDPDGCLLQLLEQLAIRDGEVNSLQLARRLGESFGEAVRREVLLRPLALLVADGSLDGRLVGMSGRRAADRPLHRCRTGQHPGRVGLGLPFEVVGRGRDLQALAVVGPRDRALPLVDDSQLGPVLAIIREGASVIF